MVETNRAKPAARRAKPAKLDGLAVQSFSVAPEFALNGVDSAAVKLHLGLGDSDGATHPLSLELSPEVLDNLVQQLQHARRMAWPAAEAGAAA